MKGSGSSSSPSSDPTSVRPKPGSTGRLISAHYLEIGHLLDRIDGATTHYQMLALERSASEDEIVQAYHDAIAVLHPTYHKVRAAVPDEMLDRVDSAFNKLSKSFMVLTNPSKRAEYDASLARGKVVPLLVEVAKPKKRTTGNLKRARARAEQDKPGKRQSGPINIKVPMPQAIYTKPAVATAAPVNRRRCERFNLCVPVFVKGYDRSGNRWQEVTKTINVSRMGVALRLQAQVRHGSVVHVTLPLPIKLRSHGFSEPGYNMYAIVRRIEPMLDDARVIGLEFIGSQPPAGYLHKPWSTFRTQRWDGLDRRREPRIEHVENILVEYLDESNERLAREVAITENISRNGARLRVKQAPDAFEMVRVTSGNQQFSSLAVVRNRFAGTDGGERLCIQFTEACWPLR